MSEEAGRKSSLQTRGRSTTKGANSLSPMANGGSAFRQRRRSTSSKRTPVPEEERPEPKRRGSQGNDEELSIDVLTKLAMKVESGKEGKLPEEVATALSEEEKDTLTTICKFISGSKTGDGKKKTFKDIAREEILREPSELSKMIANAKVISAHGRRHFEKEEIFPEIFEPQDENEVVPLNDNEELKFKVKAAKARYLTMFEKKVTKEEEEQQKLAKAVPDPKAYGLWDSVSSVKALPTLMKVKKEWVPKDWDKIMENLKKEGRDVASIDADLKDICHGAKELGRSKTGKYLMPEDIKWCRQHARFSEKDLLKWFRRFRERCPKGVMNEKIFKELFKEAFPTADVEVVSGVVFEVFDNEKKELDFKDFLVALDAVNCKEYDEKLRWAIGLWDQKKRNVIDFYGMKRILQLMDQVEENGFMDGATEEDMDNLMFRRKLDPLKLVEDRVTDLFQVLPNNTDGTIDITELENAPAKIVYARD